MPAPCISQHSQSRRRRGRGCFFRHRPLVSVIASEVENWLNYILRAVFFFFTSPWIAIISRVKMTAQVTVISMRKSWRINYNYLDSHLIRFSSACHIWNDLWSSVWVSAEEVSPRVLELLFLSFFFHFKCVTVCQFVGYFFFEKKKNSQFGLNKIIGQLI